MREFWSFVWWFSETFHIPLGRLAPFVFGKMIGVKGVRVDKLEQEVDDNGNLRKPIDPPPPLPKP